MTEVALLCRSNLAVFSTTHFVCFDTNNLEPRRQLEPKGYGVRFQGRDFTLLDSCAAKIARKLGGILMRPRV